MPRNLTAGMVTAISKRFTNPIYLVAQDMGANVLYGSTREAVEYGGQTYLDTTGLKVSSLTPNSVAWSLDNSDRATSILALSNDVGGNSVTLHIHYEGETVTLFTGIIDEWYTRGQRVEFKATSLGARQQKYPNSRAENGVFNHLPSPGSNIMWGTQSIILESEPN